MVAAVRRAVQRAAPKPVATEDAAVKDLQRQVRELQGVPVPWSSGNELDFDLTPIGLSTGPAQQYLKHKLGRVPKGWIVCDLVCPQIAVFPSRGSWTAEHIQLVADRICHGKVLVY